MLACKHFNKMLHMYFHPLFLFSDRALALATITAGDPFVKQANLIPGVIVLLSTAPNGDTAPPTPEGQALTPTPSPSHCHPSSLKGGFVTTSHFGSLT